MPEQILVITFTKAAAIEMKERFSSMMRDSASVVFGTFHSAFLHMLRQEKSFCGFELLTGRRRQEILKEVMTACKITIEGEDDLDVLGRELSYVVNSMISPSDYCKESMFGQDFIELFEHYRARKKAYHLMDFDDILTRTVDLLKKDISFREKWQRQFAYILVDEAQDMNPVQYEAICLLALPQNNLFLVGDDDQSIYGFRGASPNLMLRFQEDYPHATLIRLGENYRSSHTIVEASGRLIACNTNRYHKVVKSCSNVIGAWSILPCENDEHEALLVRDILCGWRKEGVAYTQMAVLFRNYIHCQSLVEKLTGAQIPFYLRERVKNPYQHQVMLDLVAYLRLGSKMLHRRDLFRIMNRPNRYLARASVEAEWITFAGWKRYYRQQPWIYERLEQWERHVDFYRNLSGSGAVKYIRKVVGYDEYLIQRARTPEELEQLMQVADSMETLAANTGSIREVLQKWEDMRRQFERMNRDAGELQRDGVGLFTLHSSKGLEFEKVVILGCNEGMLPSKKAKTGEQIEEERRLFYVGVTRAKRELILTYREQEGDKKISPSRFLQEMQGADEAESQFISSNSASSKSSSNRSSTASYSSSDWIFSRDGVPFSSS